MKITILNKTKNTKKITSIIDKTSSGYRVGRVVGIRGSAGTSNTAPKHSPTPTLVLHGLLLSHFGVDRLEEEEEEEDGEEEDNIKLRGREGKERKGIGCRMVVWEIVL